MTNKEINDLFRKVISSNGTEFRFSPETGLFRLNGSFCSDELREIARVLDEVNHGTPQERELDRIKKLNVKGFRAKDIKVLYFKMYNDNENYNFSFYIMKDRKDWDFYYGKSSQGAGDWWPDPEDELYLSPIHDFIPSGFAETCENVYEYCGTNEEAIETLKKCGFTVEKNDTR